LAKLAGAMKGSLAKAARVFDALRIKLESEQGSPAPVASEAVSEVPAQEATTEVVVEAQVTEEVPPTEEKE
jgi:large subunit ribosomal protein L10